LEDIPLQYIGLLQEKYTFPVQMSAFEWLSTQTKNKTQLGWSMSLKGVTSITAGKVTKVFWLLFWTPLLRCCLSIVWEQQKCHSKIPRKHPQSCL
jgi:hypothetical protein